MEPRITPGILDLEANTKYEIYSTKNRLQSQILSTAIFNSNMSDEFSLALFFSFLKNTIMLTAREQFSLPPPAQWI